MSDHSPIVHQASTFSDLPASSHMSSDLFGLGLQGLCVMVLVDQEIQSVFLICFFKLTSHASVSAYRNVLLFHR